MKVPDCNNHGNCFNGECQCSRGYTGNACQQGRNIVVIIMIMITMMTMILVMIMIMMTMLLLTANFISSMDDNSLSCAWWIFPNWMLLPLPLLYKTIWEEMWNDRSCIIPPATGREIRNDKTWQKLFLGAEIYKYMSKCAYYCPLRFVGIKENDKTRRRSTRTEIAAN